MLAHLIKDVGASRPLSRHVRFALCAHHAAWYNNVLLSPRHPSSPAWNGIQTKTLSKHETDSHKVEFEQSTRKIETIAARWSMMNQHGLHNHL